MGGIVSMEREVSEELCRHCGEPITFVNDRWAHGRRIRRVGNGRLQRLQLHRTRRLGPAPDQVREGASAYATPARPAKNHPR